MFIFKRKRKIKLGNGKTVVRQSQKWYVWLTDADGIKRTIPLFRDKTASEQRAAQLAKEIELAKAGVVNPYSDEHKRPLTEHLKDFRQYLLDKDDSADYARLTHNRVRFILAGCKFVYTPEVQASKVQRYLGERKEEGLGIKSCNHYLTAAKNFFSWMVADKRTNENPLLHLKGRNAKKDVRHERRALTPEEINKLLTVTLENGKHHNLSGRQRYMLYLLALTIGFRAKELGSLTWHRLDLSESEPSITVTVAYAKNDKEVTLPLRRDVADQFRQWFAEDAFSMKDRIFPKFNEAKGAQMLRKDLEAAGIPYQDECGRYADFHACRHSFCTHVIRSGATAKEAQTLARHSTSALTLDVYSHVGLYDERRAVERLPKLGLDGKSMEKNRAAALRTGTDNRPIDVVGNNSEKLTPKWTPKRTPSAYSESNQSAKVGNKQKNPRENSGGRNRLHSRRLGKKSDHLAAVGMRESTMGRGGIEPPTHGFSVRCSTD